MFYNCLRLFRKNKKKEGGKKLNGVVIKIKLVSSVSSAVDDESALCLVLWVLPKDVVLDNTITKHLNPTDGF